MPKDRDMMAQRGDLRAVAVPAEAEVERSEDEAAAGTATAGAATPKTAPNPEVPAKAKRRQFSARYKLRILDEVDACEGNGDIGRLLRREGLYSSHLSEWRRAREAGALQALEPKKRGRKTRRRNPLADKVAELERKNAKLESELSKAQLIISVQKKVAALFERVAEDPS